MNRIPRQLKWASPDSSPVGTRDQSAFTLVELMVACAVMAVMLVLISVAIGQVSNGVKSSSAKVEAFQSARAGFETVTRALSVATLNTYWDYYDSANNPRSSANYTNFIPANYGRQSDLHFLVTNLGAPLSTFGGFSNNSTVTHGVFFQAPLGYNTNGTTNPPGSLNACGFFVAFGPDPTQPAITGLTNRPRFRLYQWLQSSEALQEQGATGRIDPAWINPSTTNGARPLAENIIAFVVRVPGTNATVTSTNATNYFWNSTNTWSIGSPQPPQMHQLPPLVEVTMVAVDEAAANRRLVGTATNNTANAANALMTNGIQLRNWFTNSANYSTDLQRVTDGLNARKIPYRVFTTTIPLRGSRWSP